jgi:hypothetical protein
MIGLGFAEILLLFGFPSDLPLSLPPGPESPRVLSAAPAECFVYYSWAGIAEAAPGSKNRTEQFLADPEVRQFVGEIKSRLKEALLKGAGDGERAKAVAEEIPTIVETLLGSHGVAFLEEFTALPPIKMSAGVVLHVGDKGPAFEKSWLKLEGLLGQPSKVEKVDDVDWHIMPGIGAMGIDARWALTKGDFVLAFGPDMGKKIVARMEAGEPAQWLTDVRKRLNVPRISTVKVINVKKFVEQFQAEATRAAPQQGAIFEQLGLTKLDFLAAVSGLDESGCVGRTLLKMDGQPAFFLKALDARPLTPDDLKAIPADATIAAALRFDAGRTMAEFQKMVDAFGPRPGPLADLDRLSDELGFNIREDLIPALGDSWRVYHSPREGGSLFTNWTAVVSVKDPKKLADVATVVTFKAREARRKQRELNAGRRGGRFVTIEQMKVGEHDVSFANFVGEESPIAPAWCFTGKELIVSTFPQGVKSYLLRSSEDGTLADRPAIAARFGKTGAPLVDIHYDSAELCKALYPLALHFGNMVVANLQREGINVDIAMIPTLSAFLRHVQPASTSVIATEDGVEIISRSTLPISVGPSAAVALFGLRSHRAASFSSGPRVGLASAFQPAAAMREQSRNNLKQIGLAMHNFHDTSSKFPAAFTSKKDKPLLSWRVQLLPFLDQAPLFNRFRQDEPWDSPHNKALIPHMPAVFKAPGSQAGEGKTNYVTIRAAGTIFPGATAVGIREITDGTSNTIMVVEASDKAAVTWTAPDDLPLDEKDPLKNLVQLRDRGFLAGLADGSVRFISEKINQKTLLNLFLKSDGNAIEEF